MVSIPNCYKNQESFKLILVENHSIKIELNINSWKLKVYKIGPSNHMIGKRIWLINKEIKINCNMSGKTCAKIFWSINLMAEWEKLTCDHENIILGEF